MSAVLSAINTRSAFPGSPAMSRARPDRKRLGVDDCRRSGHSAGGWARSGSGSGRRAPPVSQRRQASAVRPAAAPLDRLRQERIGASFETFAAASAVASRTGSPRSLSRPSHEAQRRRVSIPRAPAYCVEEHDVIPVLLEGIERLVASLTQWRCGRAIENAADHSRLVGLSSATAAQFPRVDARRA